VAWKPLGWEPEWFAEIEPFPSAVLKHHYPQVPNLGDMTALPERILSGEIEAPEVFCGGTPCQAFSVAGNRESLADARGNLTLTFCEIANAIDTIRAQRGEQPCIVFWENVPGVLNTKDNAFGCFLGALAGEDCALEPPGGRWTDAGCVLGPERAIAWRTLDAQFFQLAQRRRRVFVVASARNGFDPAAVLFEFDGVRRDTAPSREAGQAVAPCVTSGAANGSAAHGARSGSAKDNLITPVISMANGQSGAEIGFDGGLIARCVTAGEGKRQDYETCTMVAQPINFGAQMSVPQVDFNLCQTLQAKNPMAVAVTGDVFHTLRGEGFDASEDGTGRGTPLVPVAVQASQSGVRMNETIGTLDANYGSRRHNGVMQAMQVRRLTPVECERLQGFPDDWTQIPWRKKPASECPDGPRYKALGNSWAVPVVRWIGVRINQHMKGKK